jgi:hypothetical protein
MSSFLIRSYASAGEWLRLSIGWTAACLIGCAVFNLLLGRALPALSNEASSNAFLGSTAVAHCLIWWQAVLGGDATIRHEERQQDFTWTRLAANVWLVGLTALQWLSLFGLLLLALFRNSTDMGPFLG